MSDVIKKYSILFTEYCKKELNENLTDNQLEIAMKKLFDNFTNSHAEQLTSVLLKNFPPESKRLRKEDCRFDTHNYRRWKEGFDLIYLLLDLSLQIGRCAKIEVGLENEKGVFYRLQAAIYLHARGLLVSREIFTLMKSGFPDGALGRWRTLHELAVINCFIAQNSEIIAQRYFEARIIQSRKAVKQYIEYQQKAKLTPFNQVEHDEIENEYLRVINTYGKEVKNDYGWAAPAFKKDNPSFFDIEKSQNLDHWRPRYKWACQDTHGNFRPNDKTLAMSEANEDMLLVGKSNSGMVDPAQMLCITLGLLTSPFLILDPTPDIAVLYKSFQQLLDKTYDYFKIGDERNEKQKKSFF